MNCIEVRGARKDYDSKNHVLSGLNLTIQTGSIYSLIGASGCGKTTLLTCILGMNQLDDGTIKILGHEVSVDKPSKFPQLIGYMPQQTSLVPELTVNETLSYFGNIYQMNQVLLKQQAKFICDLLELNDVNKQVNQLSGGEKRRVSFAAALIHNPKIVILDEPTVGLDSILREKIWTFLIDSTKSSNMSVIITTHYIAEAEKSNCCGLMKNGKLIIEDSPQNIFQSLNVSNLEEAFYRLCLLKNEDADFQPSCSSIKMQQIDQIPLAVDEILETFVNTRKSFYGPTLKALFRKEMQRIRRQPGEITFTILLPVVQVICFVFGMGGNPMGLRLGIVNYEVTDQTICSKYLYSTNYELNSTSCSFQRLSCYFLNEIQDESAIKVYYDSLEEAYKEAKAGKTFGFLSISSNFTGVINERKNDWQYITEYENFTDANLIQIHLDESDYTISLFLHIRLMKAFERFNKKVLRDCDLNDKLEDIPMEINTLYRRLEDDNIATGMPALFSQVLLLCGILFSISSISQSRIEGIWNRTILAGVTTSEILAVQLFIQLINDIFQVVVFILLFKVLFDIKIEGNELLLGVIYLLLCIAGSCIGLFVSLHTNNFAVVNSAGTLVFFTCGGLCGGFWPIEGQPQFMRYIAFILPTTIPTAGIRNIIIKGFTITHYTVYGAILLLFGYIIIFLAVSILSLRKRKFA
ncbi:hypothetical protein ACKWTF_009053 [Chironomus riparius]